MIYLPIFPLHTVLFPGTPLPLHIFEPRYRRMMNEVIRTNGLFGVVLIKRGIEAMGPLPEPHRIGCSATIANIEHLPDGRMNLLAIGEERFRILELDQSGPFLRAWVEMMPMEEPQTLGVSRGARSLMPWISAYWETLKRATGERMELEPLALPSDPLPLLYLAASLLHIPLIEKQELLESESSAHFLKKVMRLYRREVVLLRYMVNTTERQIEHMSRLN
ncbi:LON peptidase substrate-binding domain-containing protein [Thermanaerothrix sp.]|jgi:Lon protease-like protein|uniref:LON peptidase substrate-binding domain-containing protein n=1 Tax=Thermanaerothrix sp. TaxID=2972675 RepID=UPI002ADE7423|nr:LON peptidase substrate-binding domain-containing protein [Thermanaerothrix sp.]